MVSLVIQDETLDRFSEVNEVTEVRDSNGRLLGVFMPEGDVRKDYLSHYVGRACPYTVEEVKAAAQRPGRPLSEILHDLESR